ncbi:hypothetical protein CWI38_0710p0010 [Hamiltosporidium tvaerminnensis]|uniref:Uncharacterized protein n=1 Tax=Hamiltosporidium tvaerminnensis TaxID=1176355 RepID=A0A4Q9LXG3_9MICR|nr:hypothetical protein CWI38_0710p0010 [Hamiltosporidium tvaerminnensis]
MTGEAKEFFRYCHSFEGYSVYKYLGIIEDSRGVPTLKRLCHTRSNAIFQLIDMRSQLAGFITFYDAIRAVLIKKKIHLRSGFEKRRYATKTLGCLEKSTEILTRRAEIPHDTMKSVEEAQLNWNVFLRAEGMCHGCGKSRKTVDYLANRFQVILNNEYDLLANELGLIYKCSVKIITYMITWNGIKTVETIFFVRRRGLEELKESVNGYRAKNLKKNNNPFISQGATTFKEPTININEESELEEETTVLKEVVEYPLKP